MRGAVLLAISIGLEEGRNAESDAKCDADAAKAVDAPKRAADVLVVLVLVLELLVVVVVVVVVLNLVAVGLMVVDADAVAVAK